MRAILGLLRTEWVAIRHGTRAWAGESSSLSKSLWLDCGPAHHASMRVKRANAGDASRSGNRV